MSLNHLNEEGQAHMVDISQKQETERFAVAKGFLQVSQVTIQRIIQNDIPKGDVLAVARIAGIMAAKKTQDLIPLCHQIKLLGVEIDIIPQNTQNRLEITAHVKAFDKTGAEMEALTAVSMTALTLYDMLKAIDKDMTISGIQLLEKQGGKTPFKRSFHVLAKGGNTSQGINSQATAPHKASETKNQPSRAPSSMTFDQLLESEDEGKAPPLLPPANYQKSWFSPNKENKTEQEKTNKPSGMQAIKPNPHHTDDRSQEDILIQELDDASEWGGQNTPQVRRAVNHIPTPFFKEKSENQSNGFQSLSIINQGLHGTQGSYANKAHGDKKKFEITSLSHLSKLSQDALLQKNITTEPALLPKDDTPISSAMAMILDRFDNKETEGNPDIGTWEESMLLDQHDDMREELLLSPPMISEAAKQLKDQISSIDINDQLFKAFVSKRAIELAYILGYLTPDYYRNCKAWVFWDKEHHDIQALIFEYNGLSLATLWTYGSSLHIEAMMYVLSKELPRRVQFNMEDHHLQSIRTSYAIKQRKPTLRMGLDKIHYRPIGNTEQVEVLSHKDTGSIMRLYHQYPDHLFEPAQLDTGLYCGIKETGELISVAGIHLLSENYDVAAIGNIVTDEAFRGKGLASKCVQHVLDDLFHKINRVALNVQEGNYPAIACYQKFGFRTVSRLIEAQGKLR